MGKFKGGMMLTLKIYNICQEYDADLESDIADYRYKVYAKDKLIVDGEYFGYIKKNGWALLVKGIAELHLKNREEE